MYLQWPVELKFMSVYKICKDSSAGSSCLVRVHTVEFVRLPCCGCVDVRGCLPYFLAEIDSGVIIRVQKLMKNSVCWLVWLVINKHLYCVC